MERFFFHQRSADRYISDPEGGVHPDLQSAYREALDSARDIMKSEVEGGCLNLDQQLEIADARGVVLATVDFAEALDVILTGEGLETVAEAHACDDRPGIFYCQLGKNLHPGTRVLAMHWEQHASASNLVVKTWVAANDASGDDPAAFPSRPAGETE